ncbi:hypothetical protein BGZ76_008699 [Entomortierella beljakovae]|nr:hypothetical protein BGZ76_008699 [Entomortierella beljakovae]
MPPVRVVSFEQVGSILEEMNPEDILASQAKAFNAYSAKETQTPNRSTLGSQGFTTLVMPSRIDSVASVIKIVSIPKGDSKNGLPGSSLVLDNETSEPRGLVNARLLTAVRTAAGSALATRAVFAVNKNLLDGKDSLTLVIFGSGAQAKAHIQLLVHVVPQIKRVVVCNRTLPRAEELINSIKSQRWLKNVEAVAFSITTGESTGPISAPSQDPTAQLKHIVQNADIICTCTNSRQALFPGEWVKPGTHINMIGSFTPEMHEVDQVLIKRAHILVDSHEECKIEAGELILALIETGQDGVLAELGNIFNRVGQLQSELVPSEFATIKKSDNVGAKDITMFKSVGIAAQDVAIAALVLEKAEEGNVGSVVPF